MFHCRECTCYCSHGNVKCPFFRGNHEQLALSEIEERAKKKDLLSMLYLAVCRLTGERGCGKPRAGMAQLKKLARKYPLAKGILGVLYLSGDPKDQKKGFELCKDGAYHTGCHQMEAKLAECYEKGIGTPMDRKEARVLRHTSARRGNEPLMMEAADDMVLGCDGTVREALSLYRRAAELGLPMAQERLRCCHRDHIDEVVGNYIFSDAIKGDGDRLAQIAQEFMKDPHVYDPQEARKWYHAAAMRGGRPALELAKLYLDGEHWDRDPGLAWWYLKQAQGNKEADALRQRLETEREELPSTPAQRAMLAVLDMQEDPQRAREILVRCAQEGSICAMEALGIAWFEGKLWEKDERKAFGYLEQAWKQPMFSFQGKTIGSGSRLTGCYLAGCYYAGRGTAVNKGKATDILEKAFRVELRPVKGYKPEVLWDENRNSFFAKNHIMKLQFFLDQLWKLPATCKEELAYGINLMGCCLADLDFKSQACACFDLAAEQGLAAAHYNFALYGEQGVQLLHRDFVLTPGQTFDPALSKEEIFRHYQAAEAAGLEIARYRLGLCYLDGKGTTQNLPEGVRLMALAAENGNAMALEKLGDCYLAGIGVQENVRAAAALYQKAFSAGADMIPKLLDCVKREPHLDITDPALCAKLGICCYKGEGITQSHKEAVKWLRKAGEADPEAVSLLAECYRNGKGVGQDLVEGFRLHKLAAEKGITESVYQLGLCYLYGEGTAADPAEAARLFLLAAQKGHVEAQVMRGVCCHNGEGVIKNYREAFQWYELAAKKGNAAANRNLGALYEFGNGVGQNWQEALTRYRLAEQGGFSPVKKDLERLEQKLEEKRRSQVAAVKSKPAPTYSAPAYTAPDYTPSNYTPNPYESLDYDSPIRFVNRCLKDDLALSSSEEERRNVLSRYQSNYSDIPLYEADTTYTPPEPLDDHDYLSLLNDIM